MYKPKRLVDYIEFEQYIKDKKRLADEREREKETEAFYLGFVSSFFFKSIDFFVINAFKFFVCFPLQCPFG